MLPKGYYLGTDSHMERTSSYKDTGLSEETDWGYDTAMLPELY